MRQAAGVRPAESSPWSPPFPVINKAPGTAEAVCLQGEQRESINQNSRKRARFLFCNAMHGIQCHVAAQSPPHQESQGTCKLTVTCSKAMTAKGTLACVSCSRAVWVP